MLNPFFKSEDCKFFLAQGDCVAQMRALDFSFEMIFADPPYFLSNDGISCQAGKVVSVNKGDWDKSAGRERDEQFTREWLTEARRLLAPTGTIWICGSMHNIFSIARTLDELGFKILNTITWAKTNPPPNIACRCFTHSTEFVIWAKKSERSRHFFNYELMKRINGGKQMRDLWTLPAVTLPERRCGKHPTQKPLALVARAIAAATRERAWILDPFCGSATTGIAANLLNRRFLGIEQETEFLKLSQARKHEIENSAAFTRLRARLGIPQEAVPAETPLVLSLEEETSRERADNSDFDSEFEPDSRGLPF